MTNPLLQLTGLPRGASRSCSLVRLMNNKMRTYQVCLQWYAPRERFGNAALACVSEEPAGGLLNRRYLLSEATFRLSDNVIHVPDA